MAELSCAIAESGMRPRASAPLLSIVIPSYQRVPELVQAVNSIADQIQGDLEDKVELIVSDNASGLETASAIRALAQRHQSLNYVIHARDEGGFFQFFVAPWRARGLYTWVFGSDDLLLPGGLAHIVETIDRERPSYVALNKKVLSADLSQELAASFNTVPDRRFETFEELMYAIGIQPAFISANIELTEAARALDAAPYLTVETRHPHLAAFLEKHHGKPAFYCSAPYLVHRVENSPLGEYHVGNFFDFAVTFPPILFAVIQKVGAPADFFERMNGEKRVASYVPTGLTFVDNILENFLRSLGGGKYLTASQRRGLEHVLAGCRPDRVAQMNELWAIQLQLMEQERQASALKASIERTRQSCNQASQMYARAPGAAA
jgi:glycosyltransferase involved in cell wall biosynthesis